VLHKGISPRGLSRVQAAAYCGVSPSLFDRMVRDRLMPRPVRVYGRVLWDRTSLDDAFAALPNANDAIYDGTGYDENPVA